MTIYHIYPFEILFTFPLLSWRMKGNLIGIEREDNGDFYGPRIVWSSLRCGLGTFLRKGTERLFMRLRRCGRAKLAPTLFWLGKKSIDFCFAVGNFTA